VESSAAIRFERRRCTTTAAVPAFQWIGVSRYVMPRSERASDQLIGALKRENRYANATDSIQNQNSTPPSTAGTKSPRRAARAACRAGHLPRRGTTAVRGPEQVDVDDFAHRGRIELRERRSRSGNPRAVDQRGHRSEVAGHGREELLDFLGPRHVGAIGMAPAGLRIACRDRHRVTPLRGQLRHRGADAAAAARDEQGPTCHERHARRRRRR